MTEARCVNGNRETAAPSLFHLQALTGRAMHLMRRPVTIQAFVGTHLGVPFAAVRIQRK
jgi:hypothetical protein